MPAVSQGGPFIRIRLDCSLLFNLLAGREALLIAEDRLVSFESEFVGCSLLPHCRDLLQVMLVTHRLVLSVLVVLTGEPMHQAEPHDHAFLQTHAPCETRQ